MKERTPVAANGRDEAVVITDRRRNIINRAQLAVITLMLWCQATMADLRERLDRNQPELVRGQALVEYALILVLIAVAVIVVLHFIGGSAQNTLGNVGNTIQNG